MLSTKHGKNRWQYSHVIKIPCYRQKTFSPQRGGRTAVPHMSIYRPRAARLRPFPPTFGDPRIEPKSAEQAGRRDLKGNGRDSLVVRARHPIVERGV